MSALLEISFDPATMAELSLAYSNRFVDVVDSVLPVFYENAGYVIEDHIRALLGTNELYTLSSDYADDKRKKRYLQRIVGKVADQPLILTASMYHAVTAEVTTEGIIVQIAPEHGVEPPYSTYGNVLKYGGIWESRVHFMAKGVQNSLPDITEYLETLLYRELNALIGVAPGARPVIQRVSNVSGTGTRMMDSMPGWSPTTGASYTSAVQSMKSNYV